MKTIKKLTAANRTRDHGKIHGKASTYGLSCDRRRMAAKWGPESAVSGRGGRRAVERRWRWGGLGEEQEGDAAAASVKTTIVGRAEKVWRQIFTSLNKLEKESNG